MSSSLAKLQSLNGMFAIYKKKGPTSADVLNALKEALLKEAGVESSNPRKRRKQWLKMGHGGTLDSAASGVLVVGVGNGTKMLSSMLTGSKKYVAVGELGKATDTLDATGSVVLEKGFDHITRLELEEKLKSFTGDIMQVPSTVSNTPIRTPSIPDQTLNMQQSTNKSELKELDHTVCREAGPGGREPAALFCPRTV
ncbi:putative tRNA pseudouridine synthase 1 [Oryzias melastigma]|uniref:tRNA pseudouridine(55) synthase n=1 Tax=Oryzias melastigma TaxID=30732 RepID=A0A834FJ61_ORYME|nr:putative tRNA pseudouridine synthase 1 [Oryzias melastigma]